MASSEAREGKGSGRRASIAAGIALIAIAVAATVYLGIRRPAGTAVASDDIRPVEIADSARSVEAGLDRCEGLGQMAARDCYSALLSARLEAAGVSGAMATLMGLAERDRDVARDAHVFAHHIGIEGYSLEPDVAEVFTECNDMFSSGCYHGVIQAYFEHRGTVDDAAVDSLCAPYRAEAGDGSRWILFQCLHGMGHGLTMFYDHDLPRALVACDHLDRHWDRESCYGGAFMENVMAAISPHHPATVLASGGQREGGATDPAGGDESDLAARAHGAGAHPHAGVGEWKPLDPEDPLYPCSVVDERYLQQCYLMQTSAILHLNGGDIGEAAATCATAPERWRPTCFQSLGRDISAYALHDPEETIEMCSEAEEAYRSRCLEGAVKAFVDWSSRADEGLELCAELPEGDGKRACYHALGEEIASLVGPLERRAELCRRADEGYVAVCRRGARVPDGSGPSTGPGG